MAKNPLFNLLANIAISLINEKLQGQQEQQKTQGFPEVWDVPVVKDLVNRDGSVVLILGRIETGKTVLGYRLCQGLQRPIYAISPEQTPPEWAKEIKLEEIAEKPPPNSTLFCDDLPLYASQRDYYDTYVRTLERIIPVVRHKRRIHLLFSAQSSGMIDKFVMAANMIFFKPPNLLFLDIERPSVRAIYRKLMPIFNQMTEDQLKRHAFLWAQNWRGLVRIDKAISPLDSAMGNFK